MRSTRKRRRAPSTASKPGYQPASPLSHTRPYKSVLWFPFTPVITAPTLDMYTFLLCFFLFHTLFQHFLSDYL